MTGKRRIYVVSYGGTQAIPSTKSLIRATSAARAERHVGQEVLRIAAELASQDDLVAMRDVEVQDAKEGE